MEERKVSVWKDIVYLAVFLVFGTAYFMFFGGQQILAGQFGYEESGVADMPSNAGGQETEHPGAVQEDGAAQEPGVLPGTEDVLEEMTDPEGVTAQEGNAGDAAAEEPGTCYQTVTDDYFADALFIGDSRTVGMYQYGGLEEISTFYASTGMTVYKMFDPKGVKIYGKRQKITLEEVMADRHFTKIYLMIGINEMGRGTVESFIEKYRECVVHLQELQPDAIIYLQGIIKVTSKRSAQGDYITNEGIEERNAEIRKLADGDRIFYLDVNPLICDETGGMVPDYTYDGVHLKAQYIAIWKEYLKTHAISGAYTDTDV